MPVSRRGLGFVLFRILQVLQLLSVWILLNYLTYLAVSADFLRNAREKIALASYLFLLLPLFERTHKGG